MKIHTQVKNIFITLLGFFILGSIFFIFLSSSKSYEKTIVIHGKKIQSFLADNNDERSAGLSILDSLNDNESMLFIFDENHIHSFWMKDMKFDIDIVWLNKNKEVVFIKEHARVSDYPNSYIPDKNSLYVVEFVDGFVEKNNIKIGDIFKWE